jgi:pimeloyl-ACP methyl ester carboxylesterase
MEQRNSPLKPIHLTTEEALAAYLTPPRSAETGREAELIAQAEFAELRSGEHTIASYAWGEGEPVLLIHGWGGRATQYAAFIRELVAAGYRAVAFDGPAHGRSSGTLSSAPQIARAACEVGVREGVFAGIIAHSIGATAATIALTNGLEADSAVFLGACCWTMPTVESFVELQGLDASTERRLKREVWSRYGEQALAVDILARGMSCPLLIMHDEDDREISYDHALAIRDAWPGAVLRDAPGQGHRRILRDRAVIATAIDFISAYAMRQTGSRP